MKVGIIVPQGWTGEYAGWDAGRAWDRTTAVARQAEALGFESLWLFDHFHTVPEPRQEITFESFTTLASLATITTRPRLGQLVTCTPYRNPALVAKMISTLDTVSGGRIELGLGAGWKEDEFRAYGYGFPSLADRHARLEDALFIANRMFHDEEAVYRGRTASVDGAINVPKPQQRPRIPIVVGGNGRNVTWRLAARHADELNLDNVPVHEIEDALAVVAQRCAEVGRDAASLPVSVHIWWETLVNEDPVQLLRAYREAGISRVMALVRESATTDDALVRFREQADQAGAEFE
jgi:F420-dependent oxidoreductase-like protein